MCGIVGVLGETPAMPVLVSGLRTLEYRGYDSSGIAVIDDDIEVYKKTGKLKELYEVLPEDNESLTGIGHTRWATHGIVTDENAHPHISMNNKVAIVHNGIIDNHILLKEVLGEKGYEFKSQTDSEVIAQLIEYYLDDDPMEAFIKALQDIEGTYGIVAIFKDFPDVVLAGRNGSPLVLGLGKKHKIIASDQSAFSGYCDKAIFLDDNEIVKLTPETHIVQDTLNNKIIKKEESISSEIKELSKGKYDHYLLKEINYQAESFFQALGRGSRVSMEWGTSVLGGLNLSSEDFFNIDHIHIIGMGSALHAGEIGGYMIQELAHIPVTASDASELHYSNPIVNKNTLFLAISQSGETADTINCIKEIQNKGGRVLGIVNTVGSTIARMTNGGVYIHAGVEISVASTKAFINQVAVLSLISLLFARKRDLKQSVGQNIVKDLLKIPEMISKILEGESELIEIAKELKSSNSILLLGRGINYPVAKEGALKIKEISYIHAEGFSSGGLKHGPLALITEETPSIFILPEGDTFEKGISNIQEVKARKGKVIVITNSENKDIDTIADRVIRVPYTREFLSPILMTIPLQLLAYYLALELGREIDQPRNLAKSVTTE